MLPQVSFLLPDNKSINIQHEVVALFLCHFVSPLLKHFPSLFCFRAMIPWLSNTLNSLRELYRILMPGSYPQGFNLECRLGIGMCQSSPGDPNVQPRLKIAASQPQSETQDHQPRGWPEPSSTGRLHSRACLWVTTAPS